MPGRTARLLEHLLELVVGMCRIVMEHDRARGCRSSKIASEVAERRVPPADASCVLLVGVLGIVEQHVGVSGDRHPGICLEPGLVVRNEREGRAVLFDPVGERGAWMADRCRGEPQAVDVPAVGLELLEAHVRVDQLERHREVGGREIRRHLLLERAVQRSWPVDPDGALGIEEEREEPETFDVVEMQMREQEIDLVE